MPLKKQHEPHVSKSFISLLSSDSGFGGISIFQVLV